jgi:shikimate kinase
MWFIAMRGLPGCGKSTIARILGKRLGWSIIDKDDINVAHFSTKRGLTRTACRLT